MPTAKPPSRFSHSSPLTESIIASEALLLLQRTLVADTIAQLTVPFAPGDLGRSLDGFSYLILEPAIEQLTRELRFSQLRSVGLHAPGAKVQRYSRWMHVAIFQSPDRAIANFKRLYYPLRFEHSLLVDVKGSVQINPKAWSLELSTWPVA